MTPDRTSDATEIRNSWDDDAAAAHPRPTSGPQSDEQPQKAPEAVSCSSECAAILAAHDSERRRALAERDALAATVRRVEALCDEWTAGGAASNPFPGGVVLDVKDRP